MPSSRSSQPRDRPCLLCLLQAGSLPLIPPGKPNLLNRGTQKDGWVWGRVTSVDSDNLSLRNLKGTSKRYPKDSLGGGKEV